MATMKFAILIFASMLVFGNAARYSDLLTENTCPPLIAPTNGHASPDCGLGTPLKFCTFTCNDGYELEGQNELFCDSGFWKADLESEPICKEVKMCQPLNTITNGETSTECDGGKPPKVCTFTCKKGYHLEGPKEVKCGEDGMWEGREPTCEAPKICPKLKTPIGGGKSTDCDGGTAPKVCKFHCNSGYILNGPQELKCGEDGSWEGTEPICKVAIIGKDVTPPHSHPWQVSVQFLGQHFCGGSLIAPQWVLTTAGCVNMPNVHQQDFSVILGAFVYPSHATRETELHQIEVFKLANIFHHYRYKGENPMKGFDIALLKLERPVKLNERIQPLQLPASGKETNLETSATATSWSTLEYRTVRNKVDVKYQNSDVLQQYDTKIKPCVSYNADLPSINTLCAEGVQVEPGAPLVMKDNSVPIVVGVAAGSPMIASSPVRHFFTKISHYIEWIRLTMEK